MLHQVPRTLSITFELKDGSLYYLGLLIKKDAKNKKNTLYAALTPARRIDLEKLCNEKEEIKIYEQGIGQQKIKINLLTAGIEIQFNNLQVQWWNDVTYIKIPMDVKKEEWDGKNRNYQVSPEIEASCKSLLLENILGPLRQYLNMPPEIENIFERLLLNQMLLIL